MWVEGLLLLEGLLVAGVIGVASVMLVWFSVWLGALMSLAFGRI